MGLDTSLIKKKWDSIEKSLDDIEENEIAYWRKCYGINNWLKSKSKNIENSYLKEFPAGILRPTVEKMDNYINKLIEKANELGYFVNDIDDLYSLIIELDNDSDENYDKLEKIIKSFNIDGLDFKTFEDSIWSSLSTFIQTYNNFKKAEKESVLYFSESY